MAKFRNVFETLLLADLYFDVVTSVMLIFHNISFGGIHDNIPAKKVLCPINRF